MWSGARRRASIGGVEPGTKPPGEVTAAQHGPGVAPHRTSRQRVTPTAGPRPTHPPSPGRPRLRAGSADGEAGMITVFTSLAAVALLLMVGLVVDGGGRMRAVGRADRIAAEAARAAVEAADTRSGPAVTLDRPAAIAAASAYLRAAGAAGTVTVTGPRTVRVTATVTGRYLILGLAGAGGYEVAGTAIASLSVGVTSGDNP